MILLILRHFAYNNLQEEYGHENEKTSAGWLVVRIAFFLLMPYPFLDAMTFRTYEYINGSSTDSLLYTDYKINYVLIIASLTRIVFSLNFLFLKSKYLNPRSNRICRMYGSYPGVMYCLRANFKDSPFLFITSIFAGSIVIFTFAFRICEFNSSSANLATYENLIWMTIITMTTVGYGDYSPTSEMGRLVGCICVSWGVLIVSVMVVVLTNTFSMDKSKPFPILDEWQSLTLLKKLEMNRKIRVVAGLYIRESLWRLWSNRKYGLKRLEKMRERKLMLEFKVCKRQREMSLMCENEIDLFNEMSRHFERSFVYIESLSENNLLIINYLHEEYIFKNGLDLPLDFKRQGSKSSHGKDALDPAKEGKKLQLFHPDK